MRIPEFAVRFHRRIAAVLLLGVTGTACNPEAAGTAPHAVRAITSSHIAHVTQRTLQSTHRRLRSQLPSVQMIIGTRCVVITNLLREAKP